MAIGRFGWIQEGDDWYISVDGLNTSDVASGVAHASVTGQWRDVPVDVVTYQGQEWLHVTVTQAILPSGVEVDFFIDFTMKNATTVRVPETGSVSVRVYR